MSGYELLLRLRAIPALAGARRPSCVRPTHRPRTCSARGRPGSSPTPDETDRHRQRDARSRRPGRAQRPRTTARPGHCAPALIERPPRPSSWTAPRPARPAAPCAAVQRHTRRRRCVGPAPLSGRVPRRPARRRDPALAVVADPARRRAAHPAGEIGGQVRRHLVARWLAARRLDRQAGAAARAISASAANGSRCGRRCATASSSIAGVLSELSWPAQAASSCCRCIHSTAPRRRPASPTLSPRGRSARAHFPSLRFVNGYHDDAGYIDALAKRVSDHWMKHGRGERLVMSFHGMPARTLKLRRPVSRRVPRDGPPAAERLLMKPGQWSVTFQSRFGAAKWLEPATEATLRALASEGVTESTPSVLVSPPTAWRRWRR